MIHHEKRKFISNVWRSAFDANYGFAVRHISVQIGRTTKRNANKWSKHAIANQIVGENQIYVFPGNRPKLQEIVRKVIKGDCKTFLGYRGCKVRRLPVWIKLGFICCLSHFNQPEQDMGIWRFGCFVNLHLILDLQSSNLWWAQLSGSSYTGCNSITRRGPNHTVAHQRLWWP